MNHPVISVIGAGQMGCSLIAGLIQHGHPPEKIWAAAPNAEKLAALKARFSTLVTTKNEQAVNAAEVVILAVKPQTMADLTNELADTVEVKKPLIISVAAGITVSFLTERLGKQTAIVRCMPNIASLIGCGATGLYANLFVSPAQHEAAESILRAVGMVVWLQEEALLDTVTALSGSGPAYFFYIMETLQQAAEELGLPGDIAGLLTRQTALGAARMAIESGRSLDELRRQVTSVGGTTEKAVALLEKYHVRQIIKQAVQAAKLRSEELAEERR